MGVLMYEGGRPWRLRGGRDVCGLDVRGRDVCGRDGMGGMCVDGTGTGRVGVRSEVRRSRT